MKIAKISVMLIAVLVSSSAFAGLKSPKLQTRADVIILPDDSVVLADPFIDAEATQEGGGPLLQLLNPRIYQTIALYKQVSEKVNQRFSPRYSTINEIFEQLLDKRTNLRFFGLPNADEMNKYCYAGRPVYTIPNGGVVQQAACTKGNDTFIVKPLFLKLSIRDQAMLLIHERLTTIADDRGWINFVGIAKYTTGLNVFLNVYNEQNKRAYRELSDEEQKSLFNFYSSILELEYRNADYGSVSTFQWNVHKNGGGLTSLSAIVDPSAFVSLNSEIFGDSELEANTRVLNFSATETTLKLSEGSALENVSVSRYDNRIENKDRVIKLSANSKIINSNFDFFSSPVLVGANSLIKNSLVNAPVLKIGDNVSITDSEVKAKSLVLGHGVVFQGAKFDYTNTDVIVAEREQLINQTSTEQLKDAYYPAGVVPKAFSLTIKIPTFKCVTDTKSEKKSWAWEGRSLDANGDGVILSGWITYNGRNGLKKEFEYNYSDTKIEINLKTFERTKTPVLLLNEKGAFVVGDYLKNNQFVTINGATNCTYNTIVDAMAKAGLPLNPYKGYKVPVAFE